jgi:hypothetical protein
LNRAHAAGQTRQATVAQHVQVVDAVCPSHHPTHDSAFTSAAVPAPLATPTSFTFSATRAGRAHRSADRIVGMNPACVIRSGSSNVANSSAQSCLVDRRGGSVGTPTIAGQQASSYSPSTDSPARGGKFSGWTVPVTPCHPHLSGLEPSRLNVS